MPKFNLGDFFPTDTSVTIQSTPDPLELVARIQTLSKLTKDNAKHKLDENIQGCQAPKSYATVSAVDPKTIKRHLVRL